MYTAQGRRKTKTIQREKNDSLQSYVRTAYLCSNHLCHSIWKMFKKFDTHSTYPHRLASIYAQDTPKVNISFSPTCNYRCPKCYLVFEEDVFLWLSFSFKNFFSFLFGFLSCNPYENQVSFINMTLPLSARKWQSKRRTKWKFLRFLKITARPILCVCARVFNIILGLLRWKEKPFVN